jgi:hypothetical protein
LRLAKKQIRVVAVQKFLCGVLDFFERKKSGEKLTDLALRHGERAIKVIVARSIPQQRLNELGQPVQLLLQPVVDSFEKTLCLVGSIK